jgi:hypothetical protein
MFMWLQMLSIETNICSYPSLLGNIYLRRGYKINIDWLMLTNIKWYNINQTKTRT